MDDNKLQELVSNISLESFNKPFDHKATFNKRLRTTGGRYLLNSHNIEINPEQYEFYGIKALKDIIKHELCHYHLHIEGKGYKHRDDDFRELSKDVGAPRFCKAVKSYDERANYLYKCSNCILEFKRIRKVNTVKYRCGRCGGKLRKMS
ncbi:SprT family protein [Mammaliicoccus fleurettii]|uniref:SprT family protein n=1 Tax=Mammaliicoccus fleurettii TaxID=150056 RepID=UPI001C4F06F6|nr:SprT family protein [Mammaliicoccus fleurettii]MBW0765339.1 SprT family protein [Mammaliicoccus fleurettii]